MADFVWAKELRGIKNASCLFFLEIESYNENMETEISSSGVYKLYVNGNMQFFGPAHTAKGYVRTEQSVIPLKSGLNKIVVLANDYNAATYVAIKQDPFFFCRIKVGEKFYSASDFKAYDYLPRVKNVQRYSFQRGFSDYFVLNCNEKEIFDNPEKYLPRLSVEESKTLTELPRRTPLPVCKYLFAENISQTGTFSRDEMLPLWTDRFIEPSDNRFDYYPKSQLKECTTDYVSQLVYTADCKLNQGDLLKKNEYCVFDFGRNASGFLGLDLIVDDDAEIYVIFDETANQSGRVDFTRLRCANVAKWELKKGEYALETLEIYTMEFAQLIVRDGCVRVGTVKLRLAENEDAYNLSLNVGDSDLLKIIAAAKNTSAQNSVDLLMDCPSRERSGWINDIFFTRKSAELLTGNTSVEKNSLENFALCKQLPQLPDGMIPMCYPADHLNGEYIPNCAIWYVINACEYCMKTGDNGFAEQIKPQVEGLLKFFEKYENEYGLLEDLESWVFIEWSQANDKDFVCGVNFPTNMMYHRMLKVVDKLYSFSLVEKCERLKQNIIKFSFNGEFFEDNRVRENGELVLKGHISEACQYHAFIFDIAKKESYPDLYERLKTEFTPTRDKKTVYPNIDKANIITGLLMRETILIDNGENGLALNEIKNIFLKMAEKTNTLWENVMPWASCNHGCASYAAYLIVRALTGLNGFYLGEPQFDACFYGEDCFLSVKTGNKVLRVKVKNGTREWQLN